MPSPELLECPHGTHCGGCAALGVPYAEQLVHKGALVRHAFDRYPEHAALRFDTVSAAQPTTQYRVRAKLVCGEDGTLGLFARDSHAVIDIPECRVLAPPLLRVAAAARAHLPAAAVKLDGLDLRLVDRGVLATLIAPRGTPLPALAEAARALCAASAEVAGVAASFRAAGSATVLGTGHVVLVGSNVEPHHLRSTGPYHYAAHGSFVQAHLAQTERAHRAIEGALRELSARTVLELYAGSAALSLGLAAAGFELTAVEAFAPALAHAERAAREQKLALCTVSGQAERVTRELAERAARFDAVIVNPPRRGLSVDVRIAVAALAPRALLYMSCEPATLARDLAHFRELGFDAQELWPFDMIPHSAAVECLVVARRGAVPAPRVSFENDQLIAIDQTGYPGASRGDLPSRVRALSGASGAVPVHELDADHSGLVLFARSAASLPALQAALAGGARSFVGLSRGVTHKKGRIRRPLRGKPRGAPPCTTYRRVALHGGHSLLEIEPDSPSSAQIRQHLAGVGHPILGDPRFGDGASNTFFEHRHGLDRSFLHCSAVRLELGSTTLNLSAPLPGELSSVLESLSQQPALQR
ncbi:MAG TPA: pseudouridine synthase [Polyangiaceae bacterium]|nr:pseudouridine synthase [Polyangiaceae bacterium]